MRVTCACVPHPASGSCSKALVCITGERFVGKKGTHISVKTGTWKAVEWDLDAHSKLTPIHSNEKEGRLQPHEGGSDRSHPTGLNWQ